MTFEDLGLSAEVLRAVTDAGYNQPTPIQEKAIPWVLQGRDVLGCAQTGTGKTASFTLPMIDILAQGRVRARMPRSLIMTPTRELAQQIAENFNTYGKYTPLSMALLIGGVSFSDQEKALDKGVDVLIATPGRLLDHFERGRVLLTDVRILVVDEADRMLDMGFIPDLERIASLLPQIRQTLLFSATMPPEIRRLADKFLMNPREVSVAPQSTAASTVRQLVVQVPNERAKRRPLETLMRNEPIGNGIIFCNRKRTVATLYETLKRAGHDVGALHGDMTQDARNETLAAFRDNRIKFLIATDVAGRGLDIEHVSHVFNYDVPLAAEDYIHRIGRTGRAGRSGTAIMLVTPDDKKLYDRVVALLGGKPLEELNELSAKVTAEVPADTETEAAAAGGRPPRGPRARPRRRREVETEVEVTEVPAVEAQAEELPAAEEAPAQAVKPERRKRRAPRSAGTRSTDARPTEIEPVEAEIEEAEVVEEVPAPAPAPRPAAERKPERPRSSERRPREDDTPLGFGKDIPAFMLKSARTG